MPPLEQKINWIKIIVKHKFANSAWDIDAVLGDYVAALKSKGWSDDKIITDLQNEVRNVVNTSYSFNAFADRIEGWTSDIKKW